MFRPLLAATVAFLLAASAHAETSQQAKMKECNAQASEKAIKGDERKAFMKTCLSAKPAAAGNSQQEKMKACNAEAKAKALKGDERKAFMSGCLKGQG
ncbi:MAG TPA: PsiF family protein [Magnetospirillum sp.]|nr:PsiF family protein [Magnetospirillum sp.]